MKQKLLLFISMLFILNIALAQERTIEGIVIGDDKVPLPGVTVTIKNSTKGTSTDANGKYKIAANQGTTLVFSFVGMEKESIVVGNSNTINVSLKSTAENLGEVVVTTAYGQTKDKRTLGYATQTLNGDELVETQRENLFNALQSRVAGATVNTTSGAPGASSSLVLRGFNSFSGNNSPLVVVDGLPINNSTFSTSFLTTDGSNRNNDFTNRAGDINANDIEKITVLKGPEATALYGIDAGSGAIIITTKKGVAGKSKVVYDNSFRVDQTYLFPTLQSQYGTGVSGASTQTRAAFGPKLDPGTQVYNNLDNFFLNAFTQRHNLTYEGGKKQFTYRTSFGATMQDGTIRNTAYDRYNARGTVSYKSIDKKFDITGTGAYTYSYNQKALRGAGGFLQGLLSWPIIDNASIYVKADGTRRRFFDNDNFAEVDNPFWSVNKNQSSDKTDRQNYNLSTTYRFNDWFNITAKGSYDGYFQRGNTFYHPLSNDFFSVGGMIEEYTQYYRGLSGVMIASANKTFKKITTGLKIGTAIDDFRYDSFSKRGQKLVKPSGSEDFVNDFSTITQNTYLDSRSLGRDTLTLRRLQGVFGEYTFSYERWLNLTITGRNDWTSTLPKQSRSFLYPAASLAIIFSDLLPKNQILTLGKIRGSVAQTAKDISPYGSQSVYAKQLTSGLGYGYGFTNNNPLIVPERQNTFEVGTELEFWNRRLTIDATYYNTKNVGQIVRLVRLSYGSGFILSTLNVADTRNQGLELMLSGQPIKTSNFVWNTNFNFAKTQNVVLNLPSNIPEYYNSDTFLSAFRNGLIPGGTTTSITGQDYLRNAKGQIIIDPGTGNPLVNPNYQKIGDRNPDFTLGINNSFTYKRLTFSFLFDIKKGGDIMNGTAYWLTTQGFHPLTLDREKAIIVPGVLNDGLQETSNPTINTIQIYPQYSTYFQDGRLYASNFMEQDVNWLRLRDLTLKYRLPARMINKIKGIEDLSVFFTGTDLFIITNYSGADPSVNGNTASTQGVGGFGIDWFAPSTPRGFNAGLRIALKSK